MRVIICDRCKKELPKDIDNAGYVSLGLRDVRTGESSEIKEFENWDLCESCMDAILDAVKMIAPVKHSKPMAESLIQGSEPVEIKPTATIKKKFSLDPEKAARIRTLAEDGKSVREIAAETGVSEPTVRKYMNIIA